jgi:hypothetical protein
MNKFDKIFDLCEHANGFLIHINENKKLYLTLVGSHMFFKTHIREEKNDIKHTCKLANGFFQLP